MPDNYMELFPAFVRDLPKFSALVAAVLQQAEDLAAVVPKLLEACSLSDAEGTQLDVIGESFGLKREDALDDTDAIYKAYIKAKLSLWRWDGTNGAVKSLLQEAFPGQNVSWTEGDMSITAGNTSDLPGAPEDLLPIPAGVSLAISS